MHGDVAVLVVEDEIDARRTLVQLLSILGYAPLAAGSGPEALELLRAGNKVDLLISDVVMPGMIGTEFVEQARRIRPSLPAIMVTGDADIVEALMLKGMFALVKPYSLETLKSVMNEALAQRT